MALERFLGHAFDVLVELAPWLLLGMVVAGALHVFMPVGLVRRAFRGPWGVVRAVAVGVPLPLCSCGVIPAGIGLKKDGASDGAAIGFLISTPQTGLDSILVTSGFLGWPFAIFKVVAAAVMGLFGGLFTERFGGQSVVLESQPHPEGHPRGFRAGVEHALDVLDPIAAWIALGVIISAAISTWVPVGAFDQLGGASEALSYVIVLAVAVPLYVCATASVPIAGALIGAGFPTGAALVFLTAGPATNAATIGAVHKSFGGRILAIYLGTIIFGSMALGIAFDALIPTAVPSCCAPGAGHVHADAAWWQVASAGVLVLLLVRTPFANLLKRKERSVAPASVVEVGVDGMTCGGCVKKLEGRLRGLDGAAGVDVERLPEGRASVRGQVSEAAVRAAIVDAGFTPR